jgi:twitching motility protein PilJ
VGTAALEGALRGTSGQTVPFGLGDAGSVWLFDEGGRLRSTLGAPASAPVEDGAPSPDVALPALETALEGRDAAGRFSTGAGAAYAAYAPISVGEAHWAVGVQMPEPAAMAPLRRVGLNVLGATLLAAIAGWLAGGRLWNQFSGRLRELSTVVARAQRGDRQARLEVKRDGPVGELAAQINRLLDERAAALARVEQDAQRSARDAESILRVVQEVSNGNFSPRSQIEDGALGSVSRALNEMLDGLGSLVGSLRDVSGRVGESATVIRGCTDQVSTNATTQSRECGAVLPVAQALRSGNQEIATQCAAAIDVARRTEQASKLGQSALADLISGMDGLQRETRAATVKIKRLGERSMQISAITGTISKMSAQTDMLALNAAIEASRAGEHGQGFTVVAEEVRKLAERAAAATKEVERLIAGIQSDVNEAVSGMERQAERLEVQTAAASQAEHALERVHAVTNESTTMLDEIAGAASAQLDRAGEIDAALKRLADSAKTVQQSSEQARRTTAQLLSVSEELGAKATKLQA